MTDGAKGNDMKLNKCHDKVPSTKDFACMSKAELEDFIARNAGSWTARKAVKKAFKIWKKRHQHYREVK